MILSKEDSAFAAMKMIKYFKDFHRIVFKAFRRDVET